MADGRTRDKVHIMLPRKPTVPVVQVPADELAALPWVDVTSSNVRRIAWVGEAYAAGLLYVEFHGSGHTYRYTAVPRQQYDELVAAASTGAYLAKQVIPRYNCMRVVAA